MICSHLRTKQIQSSRYLYAGV